MCGCAGRALLCSCSFSFFFFSKRKRHSFKQHPFGAFMGNPPLGNAACMRHQEHFFLLQHLSSHMMASLKRKVEADLEIRGASPTRLKDRL